MFLPSIDVEAEDDVVVVVLVAAAASEIDFHSDAFDLSKPNG